MSETAPHPAESAPIGQPIEVFMEETPAEQVEVLQLPTTFDQAVGKFGREVSPEHENLLDLNAERPLVEDQDRTMDVVTASNRRHNLRAAFAGGVAVAAILSATSLGNKVKEAFDPANTGIVAAERDAVIDRKAKNIVVNSLKGADGPVEVRVSHP